MQVSNTGLPSHIAENVERSNYGLLHMLLDHC